MFGLWDDLPNLINIRLTNFTATCISQQIIRLDFLKRQIKNKLRYKSLNMKIRTAILSECSDAVCFKYQGEIVNISCLRSQNVRHFGRALGRSKNVIQLNYGSNKLFIFTQVVLIRYRAALLNSFHAFY